MDRVEGLGLHNAMLRHSLVHPGTDRQHGCLTLEEIKEFLAATPDSYLFKRVDSLIIKYRFGHTSDTRFVESIDDVPKMEEVTTIQERPAQTETEQERIAKLLGVAPSQVHSL